MLKTSLRFIPGFNKDQYTFITKGILHGISLYFIKQNSYVHAGTVSLTKMMQSVRLIPPEEGYANGNTDYALRNHKEVPDSLKLLVLFRDLWPFISGDLWHFCWLRNINQVFLDANLVNHLMH